MLWSYKGVGSDNGPVEDEERLMDVLVLQLSIGRVQRLDDVEHLWGVDLDDEVVHLGPFLLGIPLYARISTRKT